MIRSKFYNHFKKKCILCNSKLNVTLTKQKNFAPFKCFDCNKCDFRFWVYCDSPNYEKYCWWDNVNNVFGILNEDVRILITTIDFCKYELEIDINNKVQYINLSTIKELYDFDIAKYFSKINDNLVFI